MVDLSFFEKKRRKVCRYEKKSYLCNRNRETNNVSRDAQMAESVDALVSNTSGFTSIPVRPRVWVRNKEAGKVLMLFPLSFYTYLYALCSWEQISGKR